MFPIFLSLSKTNPQKIIELLTLSVLIHNPIQYLRFFSCVQYVKQLADVQEEDFFSCFIYANPPTRDITQEFHLRKKSGKCEAQFL